MGFSSVVTPDDLKRGDLVAPGWHPATITEYTEEPVKGSKDKPSDGSLNCIFTIKLDAGPSSKKYINEKALGFGKNLYSAVGLPKNASGGYDVSTEIFQKFVGAKIDVFVKRGTSDKGKDFNEFEDFRAPIVKSST